MSRSMTFPTKGRATVEVTGSGGDRQDHVWVCSGCGDAPDCGLSLLIARKLAERHAKKCKASPNAGA